MSPSRLIALWAPVAAFMLAINVLSGQSTLPPLAAEAPDKLLHGSAYGMLGLLCLRAFHGGFRRLRPGPAVLATLLALGQGALDELRQGGVVGRDSSVEDFVADAVGTGLALAGWALWARHRRSAAPASGERVRDRG